MTETLQLKATTRTVSGKAVKKLRTEGIIPAIVYGHNQPNVMIQVNNQEFAKTYQSAGRGSLINLEIDAIKPLSVMIQGITRHYLSDDVEHIDFYAVKMSEMVTTTVPLHFTGQAPAVKALGGTFVKNKDHVTIKCLPGALVKELSISIDGLATFDDVIRVSSISVPEGITIVEQAADIIAMVEPPRSDAELAALNETVTEDVAKVEGVVKPTTTEETSATTAEAPAKKEK